MKQKILFTLFFSTISLGLFAQKEKNYFEEYKQYHHLQMSDSFHVYKFVCEAKSSLSPKRDKEYTWYYNNTIHTTTGNYSGKLLSGEYTQLDRKRKLQSRIENREMVHMEFRRNVVVIHRI